MLQREEIAYKDTYHSVYEWNLITGELFFSPHFIDKISPDVSQWHHHIDNWKACVHPDDLEPAEKALEKGLSAEKPYLDITYRLRTNNDGWIWVNGKGKIETDADGTPIRSFGTIIDITDLKKSELALENEKELAQTTLASINEAVITTDKSGKILTLNHTAEKLFQLDPVAAYGLGFSELCQLHEDSANTRDDTRNYNPIELCLQSDSAFNINKLTLTNNNDSTFNIDCSVSPLHSSKNKIIGCVMVIRDVTHERKKSTEIEHRAKHDALTGIYNRHAFELALDDVTQSEGHQHVLCYIDLDQFKIVNDTCGHMAGDELLRQLTDSMQRNIRKSDVFARLGGDKFGVLMKDCDLAHAFKVSGQIKDTITDYTFHWEDKTFQLGASIGLANINSETSPTNALQHADAACFSAKEQGRNRIHAYRLDDDEMMKAQGQMSLGASHSKSFA